MTCDHYVAAAEARASVAATLLTALLEANTPDAAQNAALALAAPALLQRRGGGAIAATGEGHAEAATDVLLEKLLGGRRGGGLEGAERGACLALGIAAGACHAGDRERRVAAATALKSRMADVDGGAGAIGAAAEVGRKYKVLEIVRVRNRIGFDPG